MSTKRVWALGVVVAAILTAVWFSALRASTSPPALLAPMRSLAAVDRSADLESNAATELTPEEILATDMLFADHVLDSTRPDAAGLADSIASALRRFVEDAHRFPELAACGAAHGMQGAACVELLDAALHKALTWLVGRELASSQPIAALLRARGPEAAAAETRAQLERVCLESDDPFARVAAMALDQRVASEANTPPAALRPEVFAGLSRRPALEREYLLRAFEQVPTRDPEIVQELAAIVGSPTKTTVERRLALRSLGAAGESETFEQVLLAAESSARISRDGAFRAIGPALARCGVGCERTLRRLSQQDNPNARLAVLVALSTTEAPVLAALGDQLLPLLRNTTGKSVVERDQLALLEQRFASALPKSE